MKSENSRRFCLRLLVAALLAALPLIATGFSAAWAATGQITGYGSKCVDVAGANSANGTQVQLYTCNGTSAQQWTVGTDGTIRALGKCLDVAGANSANGTKVQIYDCNGTTAQTWTASSDGTLRALGKCLDATGASSADGTPLQIWDCYASANQKWTLPSGGTTPPPTTSKMPGAPYLYMGWGNPPSPATVMSATGVKAFTMAFINSSGGCTPAWDGTRSLTGGVDAQAISAIKAAGGSVEVSFGGWSGNKLGPNCSSSSAFAGAVQQVINGVGPAVVDFDIENTDEFENATVQDRILGGLAIVKQNNPNVKIALTFGTSTTGPTSWGTRLISQSKALGVNIDNYTIMPFDFGGGADMYQSTVNASEGLKNALKSAWGWTDAQAYAHMGISGMNGLSDQQELTSVSTWTQIRDWANSKGLTRLAYWSVNRDRPCPGGGVQSTCSGISQNDWDFTRVTAGF
ncbi:ricin-type beta-trefoil lectin domain protein [Actinoallomurus purpureus]|uniref:ricin-type beta-trefoil lectin domain protein n=1 Tax=Actinoallomurus purpureus TaxID=478114 RepID=UPI002092FEF1|nr:chitinase [Actinoallomurus purpureus]MCO6008461.1 ricin-type beta-trefoil lectin domain protein [Actinoallomurus purpureus]